MAGFVRGPAGTLYRIEIFQNTAADPSGYGEGTVKVGSAEVTTDSTGVAYFYVEAFGVLVAGSFVSATSTGGTGNTSEFSAATFVSARLKTFGDHYVINTTLSGIPLHWPDGSAEYSISTSVPSPFHTPVTLGYGAWDQLPPTAYTPLGTTPSTTWGGDPDGLNNAVWVTSGWETLTGSDSNAVAVTRVRYNSINGEITDADIAFDAEHFDWTEVTAGPEAITMDVQNVTAHEAGHFGGLGDIYDPGDPGYIPAMGDSNANVTM